MANQENGNRRFEPKKAAFVAGGLILTIAIGAIISRITGNSPTSLRPDDGINPSPTSGLPTAELPELSATSQNSQRQVLFLERGIIPPAGTIFPFQGLLYLCQTIDEKDETVSHMFSGKTKPTTVYMIIHRARGTQTDDMVITRPTSHDFTLMDFDRNVDGCMSTTP